MGERRGRFVVRLAVVSAVYLACLSAYAGAQSPAPRAVAEGAKVMRITVGDAIFTARLGDTETAKAFASMLPLTVTMSELNEREKFYNLPVNLPATSTERPATIQAGEIMCWSSNCLVLFYRSFSNSYGGYIRLGKIADPSGLEKALGRGSVTVKFAIAR